MTLFNCINNDVHVELQITPCSVASFLHAGLSFLSPPQTFPSSYFSLTCEALKNNHKRYPHVFLSISIPLLDLKAA